MLRFIFNLVITHKEENPPRDFVNRSISFSCGELFASHYFRNEKKFNGGVKNRISSK